jgi:hypothetical protein
MIAIWLKSWYRRVKRHGHSRVRRRVARWGSPLTKVEVCEPREVLSALTWSAGGDLPIGRADAKAVLLGETVFLLGGSANGDAKAVQTLQNGSATGNAPPIDTVRVGLGAGVTKSGQIVLFGGVTAGRRTKRYFTIRSGATANPSRRT